MNFVRALKAAAPTNAAVSAQAGADQGNPYVYQAIGGKNPQGKGKVSPDLNVMGQAPGQTFPTIRGMGDSNASPPVYSAPGNPVTVASKSNPTGINQYSGGSYEARAEGATPGLDKHFAGMSEGDTKKIGQGVGEHTHTVTRTADGFDVVSNRAWDKGKTFQAKDAKAVGDFMNRADVTKIHKADHHPVSGQFISKPAPGVIPHDQRTRTMFSTLTTRKSFNATQQTLAPAIKADTLAVSQVASQSRLDNPAVYKSGAKPAQKAESVKKSDAVDGTQDNSQSAYNTAQDAAYATTSGANDASSKAFSNSWDKSSHSFAAKVHGLAADAHKAAAKAAGANNDSKAKADHLGKCAHHGSCAALHQAAYDGTPVDQAVMATKGDPDHDGDTDIAGKDATNAAALASQKATGSGLQEDHNAAMTAHLAAAKANPSQAKYHENLAQAHRDACDNNTVKDALSGSDAFKGDAVARAVSAVDSLVKKSELAAKSNPTGINQYTAGGGSDKGGASGGSPAAQALESKLSTLQVGQGLDYQTYSAKGKEDGENLSITKVGPDKFYSITGGQDHFGSAAETHAWFNTELPKKLLAMGDWEADKKGRVLEVKAPTPMDKDEAADTVEAAKSWKSNPPDTVAQALQSIAKMVA